MLFTIQAAESAGIRRRVFFVLLATTGERATGKVPSMTVYLSTDGGAPSLGGGSKGEVSGANMPGLYYYEFTQPEVSNPSVILGYVTATGCQPREFGVVVTPPNYRFGNAIPANVTQWLGANVFQDTAGYPKVTVKSGTGTGELSISAGKVQLQSDQAVNVTKWGGANVGGMPLSSLDEQAIADAIIDQLGGESINVTVVQPVLPNSDITIYAGDDYDNDELRSLEWTTDDAAIWPDLTGASIAFIATKRTDRSGDASLSKAGSVVVATGANKKVRVELSASDTDSLVRGENVYAYALRATLPNGHVITLQTGNVTVI